MQFMPAAGATQHKIAHIVLTLAFSGENAEQTRNSKHNRQNKMSKNN